MTRTTASAPKIAQTGDRDASQTPQAFLEVARARWSGVIELLSDDEAPTIYDRHPFLFVDAFPGVQPHALAGLAAAGRLYASAVFATDAVIDTDRALSEGSTLPLETLALFHEAHHILRSIYPHDSAFWPRLTHCLLAYAEAMVIERHFTSGSRDVAELTQTEAIALAEGKCGVAEVTAHGLAELSTDSSACPAVVESIAAYNVACQMLDDVCDWRRDVAARRPSLAVAEALRAADIKLADLCPGAAANGNLLDVLGRSLYFEGVAFRILDLAEDHLDRARSVVSDLPLQRWVEQLERTTRRTSQLHDTIAEARRLRSGEPRIQPALTITFPAASSERSALASSTLRWLLRQWRTGFTEVAHVMRFGRENGFTGPELQVGDVFARAFVTGAFLDAQAFLGGQLKPCIDREIDHLLASRRDEPGLWSYFPALPELPTDADDLGEVLRVLVSAGRAPEVDAAVRRALAVAFNDAWHPDGSFETWLIPAGEFPFAERQRQFVSRFWGQGPDVEVVANLLHAVALFDPETYRDEIAAGTRWLLANQSADGFWSTTWYHGRIYAAYACSRLFARVALATTALSRCAEHLYTAACADGGWGAGEGADPVNTALALLTLAEIKATGLPVDERAVTAGLDRLMRSQQPDGGFPASPFVRMEVGRTGELAPATLTYGSRTVTTALACRAALAWPEAAE